MIYQKINKDRLMLHRQNVKKLDCKRKQKHDIINAMGLKSVDFTKPKVTNGNKKPISTQEQLIIRLEKINNEIKELEAIVIPEQQEIEKQIEQVGIKDWRFKEILQGYYIDDIPHKEIMINIFGILEKDNENVRSKYYHLVNFAIKALEKVSTKPFLKINEYELEENTQNVKILSVNNIC